MRLIAHRGLVAGPNPKIENHPQEIQQCLTNGLDAEVDVWLENDVWYSGHDTATYKLDLDFLLQSGLWIHAKNSSASFELLHLWNQNHNINFFWHDQDQRTLTSQGFWWTFPGQQLGPLSVAVMPEWHCDDLSSWAVDQTCYGICSDYVGNIQK